jgi:putative membrane protein
MRRTWTCTAALALAVCAPAFAADLELDDDGFVTSAVQAGITEVELARLAITSSDDPDVLAFAEQMLADHEDANEELRSLAAEGQVSMPTAPDSRQQAVIMDLRGKTGADFDEDYAQRMKAEHAKAVALFEAAAQSSGIAPALSQYAKRTLPTLHRHQEMAETLAARESD